MLQRDPAWLGNSLAYSITACYPFAMAHSFTAWLRNSLAYSIAARYSFALAHSFTAWLGNAMFHRLTARLGNTPSEFWSHQWNSLAMA
jgi:hypothetical protein